MFIQIKYDDDDDDLTRMSRYTCSASKMLVSDGQTDRQTDASDFITYPMLLYSNGTKYHKQTFITQHTSNVWLIGFYQRLAENWHQLIVSLEQYL